MASLGQGVRVVKYERVEDGGRIPTDSPLLGSTRLTTVLVLCAANATMYINRVNLSVAIDGPQGMAAQYGWQDTEKGWILSSFFYGYVPFQFFTGWLACRFGPRRVLLTGFAAQAVLSFTFPSIVHTGSVPLVVTARIALGLAQATLVPSEMATLAAWLPEPESSRGYSMADCGSSLGTAVTLVIAPVLVSAGGWESVFWGSAVVACTWMALCYWLLHDNPGSHPTISRKELLYLAQNRPHGNGSGQREAKVPWRGIFGRSEVLCLAVVFFAGNYAWYVFLTFLPQYLYNQLHFSMKNGGVLGMLPYISIVAGQLVFSTVADILIARRPGSVTLIRKVIHSVSCLVPAGLLILAVHTTEADLVVALIAASYFFNGAGNGGAWVVPLQLSTAYAGIIEGFANGIGNSAGMVAPVLTGVILDHGGCPRANSTELAPPPITPECHRAWTEVFYICAAVWIGGAAVFVIFGTAENILKLEILEEEGEGNGGREAALLAG